MTPPPDCYALATELVAAATCQPVEVIAGPECPTGAIWRNGYHVERDADGLSPHYGWLVKRVQAILDREGRR